MDLLNTKMQQFRAREHKLGEDITRIKGFNRVHDHDPENDFSSYWIFDYLRNVWECYYPYIVGDTVLGRLPKCVLRVKKIKASN